VREPEYGVSVRLKKRQVRDLELEFWQWVRAQMLVLKCGTGGGRVERWTVAAKGPEGEEQELKNGA